MILRRFQLSGDLALSKQRWQEPLFQRCFDGGEAVKRPLRHPTHELPLGLQAHLHGRVGGLGVAVCRLGQGFDGGRPVRRLGLQPGPLPFRVP